MDGNGDFFASLTGICFTLSSIDHVPHDTVISQVSTEQLRQKESDWAQQVEKRFRLRFRSLLVYTRVKIFGTYGT